jgi:hypothetical protein
MSLRAEPLAEQVTPAGIKLDDLRQAISREYEAVAKTPQKGFYFQEHNLSLKGYERMRCSLAPNLKGG